jgi:hypothetical protein
MSWDARSSLADTLRETSVGLAWSQWAPLGGQVAGEARTPHAVVDPEALVLFSCALRAVEPRLWDLTAGFAATEPSLLSVQRMRNLAKVYPERVRVALAEFARVAVRDGKDARWSTLVGKGEVQTYRAGKVHLAEERATDRAGLMVRLRLAFGVTARTDALTYLLATSPERASVAEIARAIGYGTMPLRRALEAMAAASVVLPSSTRPTRYYAPLEAWGPLLGVSKGAAPWRYWQPLMVLLVAGLDLLGGHEEPEPTEYLWSSRLRTLMESHWPALDLNRIQAPDPRHYVGAKYLEGFEETFRVVRNWVIHST